VDQSGKQDRHLIRSGLVVIAGGLADNIEQPLSLGAVLAWTSHHDLRLPGYSLLKRHIPRAAGDRIRLVCDAPWVSFESGDLACRIGLPSP
jgi:hypothetical protein